MSTSSGESLPDPCCENRRLHDGNRSQERPLHAGSATDTLTRLPTKLNLHPHSEGIVTKPSRFREMTHEFLSRDCGHFAYESGKRVNTSAAHSRSSTEIWNSAVNLLREN